MTLTLRLAFSLMIALCLFYQIQCEEEKSENVGKGLYDTSQLRMQRFKRDDFLMDFWTQARKHVERFFSRIVPEPLKNIFHKNENSKALKGETDKHTTQDPTKEHGKLDSFGRDVIRHISKGATKVSDEIGHISMTLGIFSSNASSGLDVNKSFFDGVVEGFKKHTQLIVPGTLWCGDGTKAENREDLGHFNTTDACCRQHDECDDSIPAGEQKYGLENTGLFTRSNCECDTKFYRCLKKANNMVAEKIGFTFFSVLGPQCFKKDYPIMDCNEYKSGKCLSYKLDRSSRKKMQWFDSPPF